MIAQIGCMDVVLSEWSGVGKKYKPKPESKNILLLLFGKKTMVFTLKLGIYLITGYLRDGYLPVIYWVFTLTGIYLMVFTRYLPM